MKETKNRLDLLLVEQKLAASREQARRLIMTGAVLVNDQMIDKPGHLVPVTAAIRVCAAPRYVSRGGLKLEAALETFAVDVTGLTAVDVGASTGGFTDCLLQKGATHVYAVDVGYGQLAWKLRQDRRVSLLERTNIRYLEQLPGGLLADLAVVDTSFISLKLVLPAVVRLLQPDGQVIALIKPQFEAGREQVGKRGVVRIPGVHRQVIEETATMAAQLGLTTAGLTTSPVLGPAGNVEFLIWLRRHGETEICLDRAVSRVLAEAAKLQ